MGEIITDDEVDEMVRMCDDDGDGQVVEYFILFPIYLAQISYEEFRIMVIHPDPSRADFKNNGAIQDNGPQELPDDRKKMIQLKQQKKSFLKKFVEENEIHVDDLNRAFQSYQSLNQDEIDFDDFCGIFEIEPTGEYRRLYSLFAGDEDSAIDIKEFLLGTCIPFSHLSQL